MYIKVGCENCDVFQFSKLISYDIQGIRKHDGHMFCDSCTLVISAEDNVPDNLVSKYAGWTDLFQRLIDYNDVVDIELVHKDNCKRIWTPYEETEYCKNACQKTYLDDEGNLHIEIKEL